jgi:hypothetical protein
MRISRWNAGFGRSEKNQLSEWRAATGEDEIRSIRQEIRYKRLANYRLNGTLDDQRLRPFQRIEASRHPARNATGIVAGLRKFAGVVSVSRFDAEA